MSGSQPPKDIREALGALLIGADESRPKDKYAFWGTQPVAQFDEAEASGMVGYFEVAAKFSEFY